MIARIKQRKRMNRVFQTVLADTKSPQRSINKKNLGKTNGFFEICL